MMPLRRRRRPSREPDCGPAAQKKVQYRSARAAERRKFLAMGTERQTHWRFCPVLAGSREPGRLSAGRHDDRILYALSRLTLLALLLVFLNCSATGQTSLQLARLANVPDQYVGGEILRFVYARLGIAIELVDLPAGRALTLSNSGTLDGEIQRVAGITRNFPALIQVMTPINYIEPAVFAKRLDFTPRGWASLKDYDIGIVRGVGSSEAGTKDMPRVQASNGLDTLIAMLDADRVDLIVTDLLSGRVQLRRMKLTERIHPLLPPLERIPVYHYLHQRHAALVERVDTVIRCLDSSGDLARLRAALVKQVLDEASLASPPTPEAGISAPPATSLPGLSSRC
jgi:polar amino acid transport system substrate-binding protein